jgi:hypothetical protein
LRGAGGHAQQCHAQRVHGIILKALEFDEPWSCVKKSRNSARTTRRRWLGICGITWQ